jgi:hypothetical protein
MKIDHCTPGRTVWLVPGHISAPAECFSGLCGTVVRIFGDRVDVHITTESIHQGRTISVLPDNLAASEPRKHRGANLPPLPSRAKPLPTADHYEEVPLWP